MKSQKLINKLRLVAVALLAPLVCGGSVVFAASDNARITTIASTVPGNGDVNPYGVAIVKQTEGTLTLGNVLVSNFNNSANLQGTGSTIVDVSPNGAVGLFAHIDANTLPGACPGGVGLTTALVALQSGWVIVGSLPTTDGTAATARAGCLIVVDSTGHVAETITDPLINGPWDMAAVEDDNGAKLFVSNVLNGTVAANGAVVDGGTVIRIDLQIASGSNPTVKSITKIGAGFLERTDPAALVIGPTGLGLSPDGNILYVADSLNNRIQMIQNPLTTNPVNPDTGTTLTANRKLNDPLGLAVDDAGNIFTVNGNDGFLLGFDSTGKQIVNKLLDNTISHGSRLGTGALFGLAITPQGGVYYVDDATNTLNFLR